MLDDDHFVKKSVGKTVRMNVGACLREICGWKMQARCNETRRVESRVTPKSSGLWQCWSAA
jgi:hypothetical protein